jgi:DNA-binding NarL/FixJ family response regulator
MPEQFAEINFMETASTELRTIKVVIIEDLRDIREGLATMLNFTEGFRCVGKFGSMEEALRNIARDLPDVVLSDIGLPGMDGIEGVRIIKERYPEMTVLMLSIYNDNDRIFEALCGGASGYLLKKTPPARIIESLREAVEGGAPMSPEIARKVIAVFREIRPPEKIDYELTPHEERILKMIVDGHTKKTAAAELGVSFHTVSFHLRSIYEKLQVHSKSEAVAKALQQKLIK